MKRILWAMIVAGASAASAAPPVNSFAERLRSLDDLQRRAVLRGALVSSGQRCGRVETAIPRSRYRNLTMWSARCAPGGDYGIFIGPDGSAQVRTCEDLAKLKLTNCGLPPRPPQPPARRK